MDTSEVQDRCVSSVRCEGHEEQPVRLWPVLQRDNPLRGRFTPRLPPMRAVSFIIPPLNKMYNRAQILFTQFLVPNSKTPDCWHVKAKSGFQNTLFSQSNRMNSNKLLQMCRRLCIPYWSWRSIVSDTHASLSYSLQHWCEVAQLEHVIAWIIRTAYYNNLGSTSFAAAVSVLQKQLCSFLIK